MRLVAAIVPVFVLAACSAAPASTSAPSTNSSIAPKGETIDNVIVERVVDGDTFKIRQNGEDLSVRMIGLDTPETVKPNSPIECFGPEASEFTKAALSGKKVTLEFDAAQGTTDKYGRLLAYVWVPTTDGRMALFNELLVAGGYAEELRYGAPYAWESVLRSAEEQAKSNGLGAWGACQ